MLVVRSVDTGQEREIPLPPGVWGIRYNMPWSPDGRSILVSRWLSGPPRRCDLCRLDVPSGKITSIVAPSDWEKWPVGWSADGKKVFFMRRHWDSVTGKVTSAHILVHTLETTQEEELYRIETTGPARAVLSPDRQQLAFAPEGPDAKVLMVLPTEGGKARELFRVQEGYINAWEFSWTPDGCYVLFKTYSQSGWLSSRPPRPLKRRDVPEEFWRIPVEGREPQKLELPAGGTIGRLRVHPDGKQIAFTKYTFPDDELWVIKDFLPDLALPQTLTGTDDPEHPFGLAVEVLDPASEDVKELAARAKLSGDDDDQNAPQWCGKVHQGTRGSLDGLWESRYDSRYKGNGSGRSIAQVKTVGDWVYILVLDYHDGYQLFKARRQGNRLTGGWIHVDDPGSASYPWVALIVNDERIDGAWTLGSYGGRLDLRRDLLPSVELTSPARNNFAAVGEPVLLKADVAIAKDITVRRVEFLIDGSPVAEVTDPPYQFDWEAAKRGRYSATAKVYDSTGATELSLPVDVMAGIRGLRRFVAHTQDDAEEPAETGSMDLTGPGLNLGRRHQQVAIRFGEIGIPQGTLVKKAYLQFTTTMRSSEWTNLVIHAELAANAQPFSAIEHNITSRRKTTAAVKWSPEPWNGVGERAEKQQTPDLSTLIQEVLGQPDWQEGNALVLLISGSGERGAASYDSGGRQYGPMLHIEY